MARKNMKIGTLLTTAIVSLAAIGGGLAAYVAVTKYETMDKVSIAQNRLAVVRAVGDIPRYLNSERGFATNILFGPATVDPKLRAELNDKYRKNTDGARARMNELRKVVPDTLDDGAELGTGIDAINTKFTALRDTMDKALDGPAEARKDTVKKIIADNAVLNRAVTALLDEQVRKMARLHGDAYRQTSNANIAWTLRDVGGYGASLHKSMIGSQRAGTDAEKAELYRAQGRADQLLMSLQELKGNAATPPSVTAALAQLDQHFVEGLGQELKLVKEGAVTGKYPHDVDTFYEAAQRGLNAAIGVRDAFYDNAEQVLGQAYSSARFSFIIALAGLVAVAAASAGLVMMVRRRVCEPIVDLTTTMSRLAGGDVTGEISGADRDDEIGAMASTVRVFKDNMIRAERLAAEKEAENDTKVRRAQMLDDLARTFEAKVGELVGGLSSASATMENTAQSMSSTASATNRQAAVVAAASEQTSSNVQTVATATEELTSSIAEIGRQVAQSTEISEQIAAIQSASDQTVTAIKNVVDVITEIDQIGTAIASAIEEQGSATKEISRSVQEAARGTQEVNSNISGVQQAADDTGAAANHVLGAAEQLSAQSRDLAGEVTNFLAEVRAA